MDIDQPRKNEDDVMEEFFSPRKDRLVGVDLSARLAAASATKDESTSATLFSPRKSAQKTLVGDVVEESLSPRKRAKQTPQSVIKNLTLEFEGLPQSGMPSPRVPVSAAPSMMSNLQAFAAAAKPAPATDRPVTKSRMDSTVTPMAGVARMKAMTVQPARSSPKKVATVSPAVCRVLSFESPEEKSVVMNEPAAVATPTHVVSSAVASVTKGMHFIRNIPTLVNTPQQVYAPATPHAERAAEKSLYFLAKLSYNPVATPKNADSPAAFGSSKKGTIIK
jgi:hypothetical protein